MGLPGRAAITCTCCPPLAQEACLLVVQRQTQGLSCLASLTTALNQSSTLPAPNQMRQNHALPVASKASHMLTSFGFHSVLSPARSHASNLGELHCGHRYSMSSVHSSRGKCHSCDVEQGRTAPTWKEMLFSLCWRRRQPPYMLRHGSECMLPAWARVPMHRLKHLHSHQALQDVQ